jgi:hypothetical protein
MFKLDIKALSTSTYMSDKNKLYEAIRDWQKEHTVAPKDNSNSAWSKRVAKYSGTHHAARTHQFD